jgi:plastocyanin
MTQRFFALAAAFAIVGLTYGCGSSTSSPSQATADVTVQMVGDKGSQSYSPNPTSLRVGQTIAWHNSDTIAHTSTKDGGGFDTGSINGGATSAPITMSTAGTFTYHCTLHPGMVGTITVQ